MSNETQHSRRRFCGDALTTVAAVQVGQRIGLHLSHRLTSVGLDRDLADAELAADPLVQQAGDDQRHDLLFARTEGRVPLLERPGVRLTIEDGVAARDGVTDRAQQRVVSERLRQDLDGARLHRPDRHRHVAVTRDEDDRHVAPIGGDALLQLETIEARKRHVEHEAARSQVRFRVLIDGQPPGAAHGVDVDELGNGKVTDDRLYQLIRQPKTVADRQFEIEFLDAGVVVFSFTFG